MNRNYRIVFNRKLGIQQVASEHARAQGKGGAVVRAGAFTLALLTGLYLTPVMATDLDIIGGDSQTSAGDATYDNINVGSSGVGLGSLTISGSDKFTTDSFAIGVSTDGSATVSGTGSTLAFSTIPGQSSTVGANNVGTLLIENGGTVTGNGVFIGSYAGGVGTVTVTGAGSNLTTLATVLVGRFGEGTLNIQAGGLVRTNSLGIGYGNTGTGTLNLLGSSGSRGILEINYLNHIGIPGNNGTAIVNFDGGILRATSNQADYFQRFVDGEVTIGGGGLFFDTQSYSVATDLGLQGSGGLTKQGSGTLTLTGTSSYSGDTVVEGGKLIIEDGGSVSSAAGVVGKDTGTTGIVEVKGGGASWTSSGALTIGDVGNGTLLISAGGVVSSAGAKLAIDLNGRGTITVTGDGSRWDSSANIGIGINGDASLTISDGGVVKAGTHTVTVGSAFNTAQINLNGTSGARGVLEAGQLAGGGTTLNKVNFNGGILRLTANQSFLFNSFAAGHSVTINAGGAFVDTQAFNAHIAAAGMLQGAGGLTKQGSGTLSVAGSNMYDGNTTVEGGTLQFDSYAQSASQTLGVGAASDTSYGKLAVTNTATFDADAKISVDVAGSNTLVRGQLLTSVISAGTLTSTTFNVSDNSALFNFNAIRNGNAVDLRVASSSATGIRDAVIKSGATATLGAADVFDNAVNDGATGDMSNVVTALGSLSNDSQVSQAATQTLPLMSAGVTQVASGVLTSINRLVQGRQNASFGTSGLSGGDALANRAAWFKPFGSRAEQDDRGGAAGFDATTWGMAGGLEGDLNRSTRIGIAYAYANSKVDGNTTLSGTQQHVDIDAHVLALYGTKEMTSDLSWGWQVDVGQNSNSGSRHIKFGGLDRTATSDYKTYTAHVGMSLSKILMLNDATSFTPTIRADYTRLHDQSYREQGADALNLVVDANDTEAFVLGADARIRHALTDHSHIEVYAGAGYDTINQRGNVVASYAGTAGQSFSTQGVGHSPWLLTAGLGYTHTLESGTEITVRYDLDGRSDYLNQSASVKAKWLF
tara:strand:- start:298511 stop:301630 length:3120 start_codon:yes stop_codon:yes gene_type:complete